MKIKKILIQNIRNIVHAELNCDQGIHFIYGQNGQGKTSIIESIYILSNLRSFRDSDLSSVIKEQENFSQIKGIFEISPGTHAELKVDLIQNPSKFEKRAYINQKLSKSSADYYGVKLNHSSIQFHAIHLTPHSTDLIRGEPSYRRNYFNQVISSQNPSYLGFLKKYQKYVDQKNALLKEEGRGHHDLLKVLNEGIASEGSKVLFERLNFLKKITHPTQHFQLKIAPNQRRIILGYKSRKPLYFTGHFEIPSVKFLEENLHQELAQFGPQEVIRKSSLVGPHRDDFVFKVEKQESVPEASADLIDVGSQGEIRSFLLALKLAELEEFKSSTGVQPVLLIDDFSSELDSFRRGFLMDYLKSSELQIFVTSTDDLTHHLLTGNHIKGKGIRLVEGKISE